MHYNYIAIEGNIGSGKTTLSEMLAKQFNGKLILEQFKDNPFLEKFYKDPDKYAFPLELSFLAERYQQLIKDLSNLDLFHSLTISDYFLNKSLIFARKTLGDDEYQLFRSLFNIMDANLPKPDLLVHLYVRVEKLQANIKKRGRTFEQNISDEYLQKIQDSYFQYLNQQPKLRILLLDTNDIDFVKNPQHYNYIIEALSREYPVGITRLYLPL